jgi:hypothetical protein
MIINTKQLEEASGSNYYCGKILHEPFAYKFLKKSVTATGDIISFIAPMEVTDNLIDLEDSMSKDYIYSDLAMQFLIEIPNIDLYAAICFQRLFNAQLGSLLCSRFIKNRGYVDGDDIMIIDGEEHKKCSVSIAAQKNNCALIHTGINIRAGDKAPSFAYSTNLDETTAITFLQQAEEIFQNMTTDIHVAMRKVIV